MTKICTDCQSTKELQAFSSSFDKNQQKRYYRSRCKACTSKKNAERLRFRYENDASYRKSLKDYREKNKEKVRSWKQAEYERHSDSYIKRANKWRDANRAVVRQVKKRYKAKRSEWELNGSFTQKEWDNLVAEYEHRCLRCGRDDVELTQDHVIPLSRGGSNTIDNIQPLCSPCNSKKHTKTTDYRKI